MKNLESKLLATAPYLLSAVALTVITVSAPTSVLAGLCFPIALCTLALSLTLPLLTLILMSILLSSLQTPAVVKLSRTMTTDDQALMHVILEDMGAPVTGLLFASLFIIPLLLLSRVALPDVFTRVAIIYCGLIVVYVCEEFEYVAKAAKGLLLEEFYWKVKEFDFISSMNSSDDVEELTATKDGKK